MAKNKTNTKSKVESRSTYSPPKKSWILRLIILIIAAFMFAGAVIMPFLYY